MGQAGLLHALLTNGTHPLKTEVQTAKAILAETIAERLLRVDGLSKDKTKIQLLLNALGRITHAGLSAASKRHLSQKTVEQWLNREEAVIGCRELLEKNVNSKLLLCKLFTSI